MTHGSLFSGIGGFDLAASWMGWDNLFHCEINEFCQKVLKHHFPKAVLYEDITKTDFTGWRGKIDIVTGGFPCQPYSQAGKRKGKADDRHLWPEMLRAIREIQPRWVVGENVSGLLNWQRGMVLAEIKADLEAAGFEVFPPVILPACGKNAPHRRNRLWVIAYSISNGYSEETRLGQNSGTERENKGEEDKRERVRNDSNGNDAKRIIADPELIGQQKPGQSKFQISNKAHNDWQASWSDDVGGWPTQSPVCGGNDGFPDRLDIETISKKDWGEQSLASLGNAIVPQIAYEIFKAITRLKA